MFGQSPVVETVAPLDRVFLRMDTETTQQTVSLTIELDSCPDAQRLRADITDLLERFPRLRQRISSSRPLQWEDDSQFNLEDHLVIDDIGACESRDDVLERVSWHFSNGVPLDQALWRFVVVAGTPRSGEQVCYVLFLFHHAMADGVGGLEMIRTLFSDSAEQRPKNSLVARQKTSTVKSGSALFPRQSLARWGRWVQSYFRTKARSPLNGVNSSLRQLLFTSFAKPELQEIRRRYGVSLNDVLMTIISDGARRYSERVGQSLGSLQILMPVSMRRVSERYNLGNQLTGVGVRIPLAERDPVAKLQGVGRVLRDLKASGAIDTFRAFGHLVALLPGKIQRYCCEVLARRTNFIVTNLSSERRERYIAGAKIVHNYALAALMRGHGVAFGVVSYASRVCTSFVCDPAIVSDPKLLVRCVEEAADDLRAAVLGGDVPEQALA